MSDSHDDHGHGGAPSKAPHGAGRGTAAKAAAATAAGAGLAGGLKRFGALAGFELLSEGIVHTIVPMLEDWENRHKTVEEHRDEMLAYLEDSLFFALRDAALKDERVLEVLTLMFKHLGAKHEESKRHRLFQKLEYHTRTNPEKFKLWIEALHHDPFRKHLKQLKKLDGFVGEALKDVNTKIEAWSYAKENRSNKVAIGMGIAILILLGLAIL